MQYESFYFIRPSQALKDRLKKPINQELFDRWWTVERYEGVDESFEDVVERLAMQNPQLLAESELPFTNAALSRSDNLVPA